MLPSRGPSQSRFWGQDLELAKKKDDDINTSRHTRKTSQGHGQWQVARAPRRRSLARLALYLLLLFLMVMAGIKFFGSSDSTRRLPYTDRYTSSVSPGNQPYQPPRRPSSPDKKLHEESETSFVPTNKPPRTFSGPVKFPELGSTLRAITQTGGRQAKNRNVLFAAASLESVATLLPMACNMAGERKSYVHFALMGRSEVTMQDILKINGIDDSCQLITHDARPDHGSVSSNERMMLSTARAFSHVETFMHPQAIILDSTNSEEQYFLSGAQDEIRKTQSALIELPRNPGTRLSWITKLDSASLAAWNKVRVDMIVQAPQYGSGNLKRLLTSLSKADLSIMNPPHLTIELPSMVDPFLEKHLSTFQWPTPDKQLSTSRHDMLSLRHRVIRSTITEEEGSVRFLESFWPKEPEYSHVLVLSPNTEVTPQFFHYLKYTLLYYRYSREAIIEEWDTRLLGLSFVSPSTLLDNSSPLVIPRSEDSDSSSSFLWQGPSSEAVLILGNRWVELHGYISQVVERQQSAMNPPALLAQKVVSKKYPSWLEYVMQLSRLRGYFTVYPDQGTASTILGVHNDLPTVPEEYQGDADAEKAAAGDDISDQATSLFDPSSNIDLMATLPNKGSLPLLSHMNLVSWDGEPKVYEDLDKDARKFSASFRAEVGQCTDDDVVRLPDKNAQDLFCNSRNNNI